MFARVADGRSRSHLRAHYAGVNELYAIQHLVDNNNSLADLPNLLNISDDSSFTDDRKRYLEVNDLQRYVLYCVRIGEPRR
jgi:hypothetical protein